MISENSQTILKNLTCLTERRSVTAEQRQLCLEQLYEELCISQSKGSLEAYEEIRRLIGHELTLEDKIFLCRKICDEKSVDQKKLLSFGAPYMKVPPGAHGKIAYVRNRYNDVAFSSFSRLIPHSKSAYYATFEACCEAVGSGEVEFTLLPIENTADGKMFGFYSLLDKHELRISAVCSVEDDELSKTVRYALAGRNYLSEHIEKAKGSRSMIFEFSLTSFAERDLPSIIQAAALCFAEIYRISGLPSHYGDLTMRFFYSLKLTELSQLTPFLTYMNLEHPGYSAIGIYREI